MDPSKLDAWIEREENREYWPAGYKPPCNRCGEPCSGDSSDTLEVDGLIGQVPVCDPCESCDKPQCECQCDAETHDGGIS